MFNFTRGFMSRKWYILIISILIYLPVAIDATVLHIAIPTLSEVFALDNNQMLWVIDIYALMMAVFLLPMGALGERIGYKRLLIIGAAIFGIASILAAFSISALMLILARVILALGASMIIPATLAALRTEFEDEKQRNQALGLWVVAGGGGAALGPLVGGVLLEYFSWGSIFLINIPLVLIVLMIGGRILPKQIGNPEKKIDIRAAILLMVAILSLIYGVKSAMKTADLQALAILLFGIVLLYLFVRIQNKAAEKLINFDLFGYAGIKFGFLISFIAMIALVGFELLISQELQFVLGYSALEAGLYILPFMLTISLGGIFSSTLLNRFGYKKVAVWGLIFSAVAMWGLSQTQFAEQIIQASLFMVLLGSSIIIAFLAATSAILSSAPPEQATAAGAIEGMSYELGTGLGVTLFGLIAAAIYQYYFTQDTAINSQYTELATSSLLETLHSLSNISEPAQASIQLLAFDAFTAAHSIVLLLSSMILFVLALFIQIFWKQEHNV
ncbi:MFS transporter [Acinetobacter rudis]|uniref:MFS transporter n=1 Tax=Acinetobacter rudis TaxID=632955 RepID=UPI00280FDA6C|nr:MFS transporter [Acinetobacter rudis]MDQ8953095.1 MFS transporter [Acinetobacter rudis]